MKFKIIIILFFAIDVLSIPMYGQEEMHLIDPIVVVDSLDAHQADMVSRNNYFRNWGIASMGVDSLIFSGLTGKGVIMCVCDTGESQHSEVKHLMDTSVNFSRDSTYLDLNGHSTHIWGIISEIADSVKGLNAKVLSENGGGSFLEVRNGIVWCADNGADIINLSLSGGRSIVIEQAISYALKKGVVVVAATGNTGFKDSLDRIMFPAAFDGVIAVGSINRYFQRSVFSTTGKSGHIVAPGEEILAHGLPGSNGEDTYRVLSGTSMATPFVAAVVALYIEAKEKSKNVELIIDATAQDYGARGFDIETFYGGVFPSKLFTFEEKPDTASNPDPGPEVPEPIEPNPGSSKIALYVAIGSMIVGGIVFLIHRYRKR